MIDRYQQLLDLIHNWTADVSEKAYYDGIDYYSFREERDHLLKEVDEISNGEQYCLPKYRDQFYKVTNDGKLKYVKTMDKADRTLEFTKENFIRILDKMDNQRLALKALNTAYTEKLERFKVNARYQAEIAKKYKDKYYELKRKVYENQTEENQETS